MDVAGTISKRALRNLKVKLNKASAAALSFHEFNSSVVTQKAESIPSLTPTTNFKRWDYLQRMVEIQVIDLGHIVQALNKISKLRRWSTKKDSPTWKNFNAMYAAARKYREILEAQQYALIHHHVDDLAKSFRQEQRKLEAIKTLASMEESLVPKLKAQVAAAKSSKTASRRGTLVEVSAAHGTLLAGTAFGGQRGAVDATLLMVIGFTLLGVNFAFKAGLTSGSSEDKTYKIIFYLIMALLAHIAALGFISPKK